MSINVQQRQLLWRVFFAILISIIVPIAVGMLHDGKGRPLFSATDQIMLGALVFLVSNVVVNSLEINKLLAIRQAEQSFWMIDNETDMLLENIRTSIRMIDRAQPYQQNFYGQYFRKVVSAVADATHQAAIQGELVTDERVFSTTDMLLGVVRCTDRTRLRLVHIVDANPNNFSFTTWARNYYQQLTQLIADNKATVRRIFVYSNKVELNEPHLQKLFGFHDAINADYRVIHMKDWMVVVEGHRPNLIRGEFGIWGESLAFASIKSDHNQIDGIYTVNPKSIARLDAVFEAAWRLAEKPKLLLAVPVSISDLFEAPSVPAPNRPSIAMP